MCTKEVTPLESAEQKLAGLQNGTLYARQAAEELCDYLMNESTVTFSALQISVSKLVTLLDLLAADDPQFRRSLNEMLPQAIESGTGADVIELLPNLSRAS